MLAAVFGFILYGNLQSKNTTPARIERRQGMMTNNIPDSDNSPNIEDCRRGGCGDRPRAGLSWYPNTKDNPDRTLPLDFSIHNPPWQYWRAPPDPPPEEAPAAVSRPTSPHHPRCLADGWCLKEFCPPERDDCWFKLPEN